MSIIGKGPFDRRDSEKSGSLTVGAASDPRIFEKFADLKHVVCKEM
jgi:hypothetical protein